MSRYSKLKGNVMSKGIVEQFVKFTTNYGDEAFGLAEALTTILSGLALAPDDAAKVEHIIDKLRYASNAINMADKPAKITINKTDIVNAVTKALPSVLKTQVDAAVNSALEKVITEAVAKAVASALEAAAQDASDDGK